jgi:hypothetical protein
MWSCELRDYRLVQSGGTLPLFDLQEVARGGICDVGARQSGSVSLDIGRGIRRAVRILTCKREVLLQEVRLPACD